MRRFHVQLPLSTQLRKCASDTEMETILTWHPTARCAGVVEAIKLVHLYWSSISKKICLLEMLNPTCFVCFSTTYINCYNGTYTFMENLGNISTPYNVQVPAVFNAFSSPGGPALPGAIGTMACACGRWKVSTRPTFPHFAQIPLDCGFSLLKQNKDSSKVRAIRSICYSSLVTKMVVICKRAGCNFSCTVSRWASLSLCRRYLCWRRDFRKGLQGLHGFAAQRKVRPSYGDDKP